MDDLMDEWMTGWMNGGHKFGNVIYIFSQITGEAFAILSLD